MPASGIHVWQPLTNVIPSPANKSNALFRLIMADAFREMGQLFSLFGKTGPGMQSFFKFVRKEFKLTQNRKGAKWASGVGRLDELCAFAPLCEPIRYTSV